MTPEQQQKALAELDGWVQAEDGFWDNPKTWPTAGIHTENLANYRESFDAIIPLIRKRGQHSILHTAFWATATPAHLCEELLRREGKWVED